MFRTNPHKDLLDGPYVNQQAALAPFGILLVWLLVLLLVCTAAWRAAI